MTQVKDDFTSNAIELGQRRMTLSAAICLIQNCVTAKRSEAIREEDDFALAGSEH